MNYYLDTEFIEGFKKPIPFLPTIGKWNKPEFFIQLVSIGIVAEDGREYYAISNEFNPKLADEWVKENVLKPIHEELEAKRYLKMSQIPVLYGSEMKYSIKNFKKLLKWSAKSNQEIKMNIVKFMGGGIDSDQIDVLYVPSDTQVYAYYADYDWVVFCSLFGRMIDLPSGMPMFCRDLKQMLDEKAESKDWYYGRDIWSNNPNRGLGLQEADRQATLEEKLEKIKRHDDYPKQDNEHNALDDANWNKRLFEFIKSL